MWRPSSGVWHVYNPVTAGFEHHALGGTGDRAANSAYVKQVGGSVSSDALSKARLAPRNATGGTDLYSQNFAWGTSLVGLPGRSGLDMGFGIGYNSLVWTKEGSTMHFDPDYGNAGPGFRLGFPTIEPAFYDSATGVWNYLMVTPAGARVGFRQTAASNVYETYDSSYAQLTTTGATNPNDPAENITVEVATTDGTRMSYEWKAGAFRCNQIKDRNGNYISVWYNEFGLFGGVVDTLGRSVAVVYDAEHYPAWIYQYRRDENGAGEPVAHVPASFAYTDIEIQTDFGGLTVAGPPNGTQLKVLEKITYPDSSWTKFSYNGYGQVIRVENHADDDHSLNYTETNLQSVSGAQSDVPRLTRTETWAENFNGGNEVVVTNSVPTADSVTLPGSLGVSGKAVDVAVTGHPDGLYSRTYFADSGWAEGLALATQDCTGTDCADVKRWTWTAWEQDQIGQNPFAYQRNPRVVEARVGDGTNIKKTGVSYLRPGGTDNITTYGLVDRVQIFGGDLSTVLKESQTQYNLATAYTDRRIIGLPARTEASGRNDLTGNLELVSRMTYAFDEGDFGDTTLQQNISPVQHDGTNFGSSLVAGRGNLTGTTRWNVDYPSDAGQSVTASLKYNTAGSVVAKITPWDGTNTRTIKIGYVDNWNSGGTPTTFAYPTSITDPANNSSTVKYRYDIGANVEANSPAPAGQTYGKKSKRIFDGLGRLERDSVYVNTTEHSYVRYEYPSNGIQSKVYAPVVDVDGDGNIAEDEVYSESWSDGAGRTLRSRTEHPGSTGGWAASLVEYDMLGRVTRQSVPTEVSVSGTTWTPAGDDATRGYLWTHQKYDWMGRVVRKIATDGTDSPTLNDSDVLISYEGCGCAGGLVTTIQGENVPRDDQPTVNARRTQKIYADILGRSWKTVVYKWDGATAYTTTEQSFNGRDQVLRTRQTDNTSTASPQTYQDVTMTFDGHGRMKTRHYPIEDTGTTTTWNHNLDDSISQVVDPRGAITDMTYSSRGLTTQVAYTPPTGTSIPDTPTSTFSYDDLGNRTSMDTPGVSETTYAYDALSRITSETVDFDDLTNNLAIAYTYTLAGGVKSVTDPFASTVSYAHDKAGRLTAVGGTAWGDNTTGDYAADIKYRAFAAVKEIKYKTNTPATVAMEYDNRLRISHHEVATTAETGGYLKKADFTYFADSLPKEMDNLVSPEFDRKFRYDFAGRVSHSEMGTYTNQYDEVLNPHRQDITYNAFTQVTNRQVWNWEVNSGFAREWLNGRMVYSGTQPTIDPLGNTTYTGTGTNSFRSTVFDAAGRRTGSTERRQVTGGSYQPIVTETIGTSQHDGDGRRVRGTGQSNRISPDASTGAVGTIYHVHSTVLGAELTTAHLAGGAAVKDSTKVHAGGAVIAEQNGWTGTVAYTHADPVTGSSARVGQSGVSNGFDELEPLGQEIRTTPPPAEEPPNPGPVANNSLFPEWQCMIPSSDGIVPRHCSQAAEQQVWNTVVVTWAKRQGNAAAVLNRLQDSPLARGNPDGGATFAARANRVESLFSTDKDDDPPGKCPWDTDGTPDCAATITNSGPSMPADLHRFSSENGGDDFVTAEKLPLGVNISPRRLERIPIECHPRVIDAMKTAWSRSGNGTVGNEAGFRLDGDPSNFTITEFKSGNYRGKEKITVNVRDGMPSDPPSLRNVRRTFAIIHSHPNNSTEFPSTPENNSEGNSLGDTGNADKYRLDFYVVHRYGLTYYSGVSRLPATKLRNNLEWAKSCSN